VRRVGIYGIFGLYNYGCEAILRGTVDFVRRLFGNDCSIVYYSRNYQEDKRIADELKISIVSISRRSTFLSKCCSKMIDILQIQITPFYKAEFERIIRESDVVMLVGGDLYTLPAYLRKRKRYRYVNYLVEFGNRAMKKGKSIMIYGASIGPFGEYRKALFYYKEHFKKVNAIICREQISVDYLKTLGIKDNVTMLPDPAFLVKDPQKMYIEKKYIGINMSEFSLRELYGSVGEDVILKLSTLLENLYLNTGKPLMFIPHVIHPAEKSDDDVAFLSKVFEKLPDKVKEESIFVKPESFLDTKHYLKQCVIAICARMHCAVNAITVHTPALFLVYSTKALGMAEYVYGNREWCVSFCDIEEKLGEKVKDMLENVEALQNQILNCQQLSIEKYEAYVHKCKDEKQWAV
jgi:colanic acid/amylovoran biosynthesis protein